MDNRLAIKNDMTISDIGQALVKSGFFSDARDVSQAIVKILAGQELGFGPIASMTGVYIVQGRPALAANLMASAVKRGGRYDYRIRTINDDVCEIEFFELFGGKRESLGMSKFTKADAVKAGTKNMDKFPRNMLFARALSNGVRWYCPDFGGGAPVYTPEELGANVDEDGNVIDVTPVSVKPEPMHAPIMEPHAPIEPPSATMDLEQAKNVVDSNGQRYGDKDTPLLVNMANSLQKKLAAGGYGPEERDEKQFKLDAIRTILAARNGGAA